MKLRNSDKEMIHSFLMTLVRWMDRNGNLSVILNVPPTLFLRVCQQNIGLTQCHIGNWQPSYITQIHNYFIYKVTDHK